MIFFFVVKPLNMLAARRKARSRAGARSAGRGHRPAHGDPRPAGEPASGPAYGTSDAATIEDLLAPLRDDPKHSAVLLDVDGVLAPIVAQPDDAHMPETTRRPLIEVAKRYGTVACVSGRRASDARRIVSLGSIAYLGSHGSEVLMPGTIAPVLDSELQAWTRRVQAFAHDAFGEKLRRLRVRLEDKEAIAALHWRGVPDEEDAVAAIEDVAEAAEAGGLRHPLGPQGARDPPAGADRQGRRASSACWARPTSRPRSTSATTSPTWTRSAG